VVSLNVNEVYPMRDALERARDMMASALKLLDESGAPIEIGAHLDLAVHLLGEFLSETDELRASSATK